MSKISIKTDQRHSYEGVSIQGHKILSILDDRAEIALRWTRLAYLIPLTKISSFTIHMEIC
jgi:hypothetical protein